MLDHTSPKKSESITSVGSHHLQEAYSLMKSVQKNLNRDEFTVFGEHIAHWLRNTLDIHTQLVAQQWINNIEKLKLKLQNFIQLLWIVQVVQLQRLLMFLSHLHHVALHLTTHRLGVIRAKATLKEGMNTYTLLLQLKEHTLETILLKHIKVHWGFSDHSNSCKGSVIFAHTSGTPVDMLWTFM